MKYRIKTEEEFIREFGIGWKQKYHWWSDEMDYLFGKELSKEDYQQLQTDGDIHINKKWWIDRGYIIESTSQEEFIKTPEKKDIKNKIKFPF